MRHRISALLAGALLVLVLAAPASAATTPVTIDLHVLFEPSTETFTAEGICPSGTAASFGFHGAGAGRATTFHLFKTLTCADGSGTITISVQAASIFGMGGTTGGWRVVSGTGTGDYAGISGGGRIVGTGFDGGIDDHYTGRISS
jgi:hypothetical protein